MTCSTHKSLLPPPRPCAVFAPSLLPRCSEVFGLQRFRETELIHGRWAMLACLGALVQEAVTGDSWVAAQVRAPRVRPGSPPTLLHKAPPH